MRAGGADRIPVGLVYRSPTVYRWAMRILDPASAEDLRVVAEVIEPGSSVIDLCCGDAAIAPLLLERNCRYLGLELNPRFVQSGRRRGLDVRAWDGRSQEIPEHADVVCILSSLYQFIPGERLLVEAMLRSARRKVIVSEPVRNWSTSRWAILRRVARAVTHVNGRVFEQRLDEDGLRELARSFDDVEVEFVRRPRQLVCVLTHARPGAAQPAENATARAVPPRPRTDRRPCAPRPAPRPRRR